MTKTTYTPDTIVLVGGEISIYSLDKTKLIASTDKIHSILNGVILLDRQQFVRPVDVYKLANDKVELGEISTHERAAFVAGYNANKGVYTEEQLLEAISMAFSYGKIGEIYLSKILSKIKPLSIPKSVTIENGAVTEITW